MNERSRVRLFTLRVLVLSLLLALFGRLWYIQVLAGDSYARAAATTREHDIITTATRGEILDDWGRPYAENKTSLVLSVSWRQLQQQKDNGYAVEQRLADVLHEDVRSLVNAITPCTYAIDPKTKKRVRGSVPSPPGCYSGAPEQPIPVTDKADTDQALQILERQDLYPGVTASVQSVRQYQQPLKSVAANLIGYLGKVNEQQVKTGGYSADAFVGASGIEQQYETSLRGTDGVKRIALDHKGNPIGTIGTPQPTVPGDNVILSIDAGAQGLMETVLEDAVKNIAPHQHPAPGKTSPTPTYPTQAAGVLMNARTGEIVASGSYPSYDPKIFEFPRTDADNAKIAALNKNSAHPLLNQAIQGQYAPGSTFKLITTSAELNSGRADWNSQYNCPGFLPIGGKPKYNSEGEELGKINLNITIAKSCDTVYYQFALDDYKADYNRVVKQKQPALENVTKMAKEFGLSAATGVDLPSEAKGYIQTWTQNAALVEFYHQQLCLGAYGGTDSKGKKVKPVADKAKRADDKAQCDRPVQSYDKILYPGNYADEYIGQGSVLATPLQMAVAYASLVNGGQVFSPKVAKAVVTPDGKLVKSIKPQVQRTLSVSQTNLTDIKNAMYDVVTIGTAKDTFAGFPLDKLKVGGKTGTAQVEDPKTKKIDDTSVFASFAGLPGQDPQYVSIIMVPKGGYGADVAGPATRELWDGLYGLEGKANVLPQGLRTQLPHFSKDGNIVTKAPLITPASPTVTPSGTATPGAGSGTTTGTTGPTTTTTAGATTTGAAVKGLGPLQSAGSSDPPAHVVAFGSSGRAPPRTADVW